MSMQHVATERLADRINRIRDVMRSSACGPLIAAQDVIDIATHWDSDYRAEAGGCSLTSYLRTNLGPGRGLAYFKQRAEAVRVLGEDIRRSFDHNVAVWVMNNVPAEQRPNVKGAIQFAWARQKKVPLTISQARRVARSVLGAAAARPKAAACERCKMLEGLLMKNGIEIK